MGQQSVFHGIKTPFIDRCIHDLFAQQVAEHPDAVAVSFGGQEMTYHELDVRSSQLAGWLLRNGVQQEEPVGVCLRRSFEVIISLLAILKAGAAYLPLDPAYPDERLRFIIEDSGAKRLLTDSAFLRRPIQTGGLDVCLVKERADEIFQDLGLCSRQVLSPSNLAYIIYTSGTTGKPKGVLVEHGGVYNMLQTQIPIWNLSCGARLLQFAAYSFDASLWEILLTLGSGASLILCPENVRPDNVLDFVEEEQITHAFLTPMLLSTLPFRQLPHLECVTVGGDICTDRLVQTWGSRCRLLNGYGPTEASICVSMHVCDPAVRGDPPVGSAIANVDFFVVGEDGTLCPFGEPGELLIGGRCLARGYLNRPELTAERFINNPFGPGRLYRTGDLVRMRPDGNLDFIGRIDNQVKLRGFRIELGEIENVIRQHPQVQDATVVLREDRPGDKRLAAYYTGQRAGLREHLQTRLPEYMVPARFIYMDALPLTPNGKVDRKALPVPGRNRTDMDMEFVAPETGLQKSLCSIWADALDIQETGIDDGFLALGGESLMAARICARISAEMNVAVQMHELLESGTVRRLADFLEQRRAVAQISPVEPCDAAAPQPLSFQQEQLWLIDRMFPGQSVYNEPVCIRLGASVDEKALTAALADLLQRHTALRTRFFEQDEAVLQTIMPCPEHPPLQILDLTGKENADQLAEAACRESAVRPFALDRPPLLRALLIRLSGDFRLLLTMHHIAMDGICLFTTLLPELEHAYRAHAAGKQSVLEPLSLQYIDYAAWQRRHVTAESCRAQLDYWRGKLEGIEPLSLPIDRPRPEQVIFSGGQTVLNLSGDLTTKLHALARRKNVTLYNLLFAAFGVLLYRLGRQKQFVLGTVTSGRYHPDVEKMVGFFASTLPVPLNFTRVTTFDDALQESREALHGAFINQQVPFAEIVQVAAARLPGERNPLVRALFTLDPVDPDRTGGAWIVEHFAAGNASAKMDMTIELAEETDHLSGRIEYADNLFNPQTIDELIEKYAGLLAEIVANSQTRVLPEGEEEALSISHGAQTPVPEKCIHQLFEEQSVKTPETVALLFDGKEMTYQELNRRASQLAACLIRRGVQVGDLVGICLNRSFEMVIAVLAVLKTGGAYVPLDPDYPGERLHFMAEDAGIKLLVTQSGLSGLLTINPPLGKLCLDSDEQEIQDADCALLADVSVSPGDLAYIIYTSGSTGRPKGVMVEHRGICNLAQEQSRIFHVSKQSRVLQVASFCFDASVWEFFMALTAGACLVLVHRTEILKGVELLDFITRNWVTHVTLSPSVLANLPYQELPELQHLILAGEACTAQLTARWSSGRSFYNAYGPTENTVCATIYCCAGQESGAPPIGTPLNNTMVCVLDEKQQILPVNTPGELYLGGAGLARGYLNRPELTAERFINNPFGPGRLYRTGDLVRMRSDGNLDFIGRIDNQVKLRGFRIELGEIEAALHKISCIKDCVVIAREDSPGDKRLVVYYIPASDGTRNTAELRADLKKFLPDYMIPAHFVPLDAFPLTVNGKVDHKSLPKPKVETADIAGQTASTDIEKLIARCWCEALGLEQVGIDQNFFDLGGSSLLIVRLQGLLKAGLNKDIPVAELFQALTVRTQARLFALEKQSAMPEYLKQRMERLKRSGR